MALRPLEPKSSASASSATFARAFEALQHLEYQWDRGLRQKPSQLFDSRLPDQARSRIPARADFMLEL